MPDTTAVLELPYPEATDPNNVPLDLKALADRLEEMLLEGLSDPESEFGTRLAAAADERAGVVTVVPTGGLGTVADPWEHADGSGGLKTLVAAASFGAQIKMRGGYYAGIERVDLPTGSKLLLDGVHFIVDLPADTALIQAKGTVGDYLTDITIDGDVTFHNAAMGTDQVQGIFMQYVRNSRILAQVDSKDAGGNPIRAVDCEQLWIGHTTRKTTNMFGATIFMLRCKDSHVQSWSNDGGDEGLDLADCNNVTWGWGKSINCSEPIDIGSSTNCRGGHVYGKNNNQGCNIKIDVGVNATGAQGNYIECITMVDMQAGVAAITFTNVVEGVPHINNGVGRVTSSSAAANTACVRYSGFSGAFPITRARVEHYEHTGPAEAIIFTQNTVDCHAGDENSYAESTGNTAVILLANSGASVVNHIRPTVRGRVKALNRTGAGNGVVQIMKVDGRGCVVWDGHILGSGADGLIGYQSNNWLSRGVIEECAGAGWKHRVVNDPNYSGKQNVGHEGVIRNCGKTTAEAAFRVVAEGGVTDIRKVSFHGKIRDNQVAATTRGFDVGIADFVTIVADVDTSLVSIVTGTIAANSDYDFKGRRTTGGSDDLNAEIASLSKRAPSFPRALFSLNTNPLPGWIVLPNTFNRINGQEGPCAPMLGAPNFDGQEDTIVKTDDPAYLLSLTGVPTGGDYTLTGNGTVTAAIAHDASAATVQTAVRTLGGPFANAVVSAAGATYTVRLAGQGTFPATNPLALGTNSLTGGTVPSVTVGITNTVTVTGTIDGVPGTSVVLKSKGDRVVLVGKVSGATWLTKFQSIAA